MEVGTIFQEAVVNAINDYFGKIILYMHVVLLHF